MDSGYLKEDLDLINEMESIGPMSTGTALSEQQRKIDVIQIKSILRSRKTMIDLDQSNKKYSLVILLFAIIQIIIAGLQLVLDIKGFPDKIFAIFIAIVFVASLYFLKKILDKNEVINL